LIKKYKKTKIFNVPALVLIEHLKFREM